MSNTLTAAYQIQAVSATETIMLNAVEAEMIRLGWSVVVDIAYDAYLDSYVVTAHHGGYRCMERVDGAVLQSAPIFSVAADIAKTFDSAFKRFGSNPQTAAHQQQVLQQHAALQQQFANRVINPPVTTFSGGLTYGSTTSSLQNPVQQFGVWSTGIGIFSGGSYIDTYEPQQDTTELMQASDVMEKFVTFMKGMGVKEPTELPGNVFVRWLAYEAGVREDGGEISKSTRDVLISIEQHPDVVRLIERDNPALESL